MCSQVQRALVELLYGGTDDSGRIQTTRLAVVLNSAMGVVARDSGAFVDFDTLPDDSVGLKDALHYFLSPSAQSLRGLVLDEAVTATDLLLRQVCQLNISFCVTGLVGRNAEAFLAWLWQALFRQACLAILPSKKCAPW